MASQIITITMIEMFCYNLCKVRIVVYQSVTIGLRLSSELRLFRIERHDGW